MDETTNQWTLQSWIVALNKKKTTGVICITFLVLNNLTVMLIRHIEGVETNPILRD
jgi:hypothetical protein